MNEPTQPEWSRTSPTADRDALAAELLDEAPRAEAPRAGSRRRRSLPPQLKYLALGAAVMGVILGVWVAGLPPTASTTLPSGHPAISTAPTAEAATPTPVDAQQATSLKAKVAADPADVVSLKALAALYAGAFEWEEAIAWQGKVIAQRPGNADELCILGSYEFNSGDSAAAEKAWIDATKANPKSQEAHYDLGVLYIVSDPPQPDKTTLAWQKVIDIDPTTELAKRVSEHLPNIAAVTATPSPATPSASTAAVSPTP